MSLIQSCKLGPTSGTPGSAQRLIERLSPAVRRSVEGVFDPVVDRVVLEDRALMELLAKVPEEQVRPLTPPLCEFSGDAVEVGRGRGASCKVPHDKKYVDGERSKVS